MPLTTTACQAPCRWMRKRSVSNERTVRRMERKRGNRGFSPLDALGKRLERLVEPKQDRMSGGNGDFCAVRIVGQDQSRRLAPVVGGDGPVALFAGALCVPGARRPRGVSGR